MLVIRKAQMEVLGADSLRRFLLRTVRHLRSEFPEKTTGQNDEQLLARLRECMQRARSYDIRGERDTLLFFDLEFLLEPRFEFTPKHAWIRRLLQDASIPMNSRVSLVYQRLDAIASAGMQPA